jgi:hypothetical protein
VCDKVDFRLKSIRRDNEGHFILIKGTIQQEISILNMYTPNIGAPNYIKKKKPLMYLRAQIDPNSVIWETLIPTVTNRYVIEAKINKATSELVHVR